MHSWNRVSALPVTATGKSVWPVVLSVALLLPGVAPGHHSQAYFSDEFTEMEGVIVELQWRNPHVKFSLRTENDAGEEELVGIETNSIYYLVRAGFTRDRIQVGDRVVVGGHESIIDGADFLAAEMVLADGERVLLIRDGVTSQFQDVLEDTVAENRGIFRVWSIPQANRREMHTPLTEFAVAEREKFDPLDNFSVRCEPAGMPRLMWYPHPYEFVDEGDRILIRLEMYDLVRTIHMDRSAPPEDVTRSRLGYSIGRWEDNTLVVETTNIDWNFYDTRGTPQSDAAEVTERFTLSDDQSRIDYHITTVDPAVFTEPATISGHWLALGEEIEPYDCEVY